MKRLLEAWVKAMSEYRIDPSFHPVKVKVCQTVCTVNMR